jgi:hypothetical protein
MQRRYYRNKFYRIENNGLEIRIGKKLSEIFDANESQWIQKAEIGKTEYKHCHKNGNTGKQGIKKDGRREE